MRICLYCKYSKITVNTLNLHEHISSTFVVKNSRMRQKEEEESSTAFVNLVNSIYVNDDDFDIYCGYEYFNNHCQSVTTITGAIRQFEFVILTLKALIKENQHTIISPIYINELVNYIENAEFEKNWYYIFETSFYLPARKYYLNTLKYELVQFNVHDNMYVLLLKCMNFHEKDVSKAMEVAFYFFSNCFERSISISSQIKWKFFGNPYISITWILMVQKYSMDSISGFRRKLVNEFWNDYYSGPDWRPVKTKSNNLIDYMKKLTGFNNSKTGENNRLQRLIKKSGSFFEIDDTIFAKFSDDKESSRRNLFTFCCFLVILFILFVFWGFLYYRTN